MTDENERIRAFFDDWADEYAGFLDSVLRSQYDWPAVESLLPDINGKRVLNVACGPGDAAGRLADRGGDVLGVDISPEMVRVARQQYGDVADFRRADLREPLDFVHDESVDLVLSQLTLGHIEDWVPVIEEFHRILSSEGTLVLTVSHPFSDYLILRDDDYPAFGGLFSENSPALVAAVDPPRYADIERYVGDWGTATDPDSVPFYRRPLEGVFDPLFAAGFAITGIEEPTPTAELRAKHPERATALGRRPPIVLCLRARKQQA